MRQRRALRPSPFLIRVLNAVEEADSKGGFTSPAWIANAVFPDDHPGWTRSCKCGPYGSHRGSGLVMMMGGYLGKLKRADPPLVESWYRGSDRGHRLTAEGRAMLKVNKEMLT